MKTTILTPEQKNQLTEKLDELIELQGFAEIIDGPAIKILLGIIDSLAVNYIPPIYHPALKEFIVGFLISKNDLKFFK